MQRNAVNVSDKMLYDILGAELEDSSIIDAKMIEAYEMIRAKSREKGSKINNNEINNSEISNSEINSRATTIGKIKNGENKKTAISYQNNKNSVWRKVFITIGSMAAVLCVTFIFCVMNPVLAREIPILGSIFARVADVYQFGKLPEESTTELLPDENTAELLLEESATELSSEESAAGLFSEEELISTDGGITISITEEYASNQAVYIGVKVENEQAFPEMVATIEDGQQFIKARAIEDYSFCPGQRKNRRYIEGKFVDEHTFLGIIRIDYDSLKWQLEEAAAAPVSEIPETFTMEFEIVEIASTLKDAEPPDEFQLSDEEYEQMTDEQRTEFYNSIPKAWYGLEWQSWHQEGTWHFTIPITQTDGNIRTIEVNQYDSDGIGVESIEISSMEMSVNTVIPEEVSLYTAVFDADGKEMEYTNSSNVGSTRLIDGHDISTVSIYLCDLDEYLELAEEYGEGISKEIVEEIAQFKAVVKTME
ncbi:MAG: DUF4179 domain-containing protein [Lachnospiraceae bacterium]|nr:DUF4179 domain-containing protein [Lachnospiraceae bacterium]